MTCLRCGHEGPDVRSTIVEYEDPVDVEVSIVTDASRQSWEQRTVPGRFGKEWRCTDRLGCDARTAALEKPMPATQPAPAVAEATTWFD